MAGGWHQFFAPINGVACRFAMRCEDGAPKGLFCVDAGNGTDCTHDLCRQLAAVTALLKGGLPWGAVLTQHGGDLGAVIEAAEARRLEIYGAEAAS
jgi:hypothetical protein